MIDSLNNSNKNLIINFLVGDANNLDILYLTNEVYFLKQVCKEWNNAINNYTNERKIKNTILVKNRLEQAIDEKNLKVLDWLNNNVINMKCSKNVWTNALIGGDKKIIEWLRFNDYEMILDNKKKLLMNILKNGSLYSLKFYNKRHEIKDVNTELVKYIFISNNVKMLKWVNKKYHLTKRSISMFRYIEKNNTEILYWLEEKKFFEKYDFYDEISLLINNSFRKDNIKIVDWFFNRRENKFLKKYVHQCKNIVTYLDLIKIILEKNWLRYGFTKIDDFCSIETYKWCKKNNMFENEQKHISLKSFLKYDIHYLKDFMKNNKFELFCESNVFAELNKFKFSKKYIEFIFDIMRNKNYYFQTSIDRTLIKNIILKHNYILLDLIMKKFEFDKNQVVENIIFSRPKNLNFYRIIIENYGKEIITDKLLNITKNLFNIYFAKYIEQYGFNIDIDIFSLLENKRCYDEINIEMLEYYKNKSNYFELTHNLENIFFSSKQIHLLNWLLKEKKGSFNISGYILGKKNKWYMQKWLDEVYKKK